MSALPALFLSHGAPNVVLYPSPTRDFLSRLGNALPRPRAIVVVSAHWETEQPMLTAHAQPETIHDFYGFEPAMYQMRYAAPGAPALAADILARLAEAGITSIVWATGYELDFRWLRTAAVDDHGQPVHRRGISAEPGVYFLGLPWQTRRGSSFIWGVWYDAKYIADHIAKQRAYLEYRPG